MKKTPFIFLGLVTGGLTLQSCYHTRQVTAVRSDRDSLDTTRTITYYEQDDVYYHPYFHVYYNYGWSYWNNGGYCNYHPGWFHHRENHVGWFHHHGGNPSNGGTATASNGNTGVVHHHRSWSSGRTSSSTASTTTSSSRGGFGYHGSHSTAS